MQYLFNPQHTKKKSKDKKQFVFSKIYAYKQNYKGAKNIKLFKRSWRLEIYAVYVFVLSVQKIMNDDNLDLGQKHKIISRIYKELKIASATSTTLNPIVENFYKVAESVDIVGRLENLCTEVKILLGLQSKDKEEYYQEHQENIFHSDNILALILLKFFATKEKKINYDEIESYAKNFSTCIQKVQFLVNIKAEDFGVVSFVFPHSEIAGADLNKKTKKILVKELRAKLKKCLSGIKKLPRSVRFPIYLMYKYNFLLLKKIYSINIKKLEKGGKVKISSLRWGVS